MLTEGDKVGADWKICLSSEFINSCLKKIWKNQNGLLIVIYVVVSQITHGNDL